MRGKTMHKQGEKNRAGFSLVEILVVLAIIAILGALAAAATMQVIGTQRSSNTELTLRKLMKGLDDHWQAVIQDAKSQGIQGIPDAIKFGGSNSHGLLAMAGGNEQRALVIWTKMRLKQQFPTNFVEAVCPTPAAVNGRLNNGPVLPWVILPPDPLYVRTITPADPLTNPAFASGLIPQEFQTGGVVQFPRAFEGAACLYMALSRSRKGIPSIVDTLGSAESISGIYAFPGNPMPTYAPPGGTPSTSAHRILVDAWGMPLTYYRWPIGGQVGRLVAASPPELPRLNPNINRRRSNVVDPLDPAGLLLDPEWNNATLYAARQGVWAFEKLLHPIHVGTPGGSYAPMAYYSIPTIISAGRSRFSDDPTMDQYHFFDIQPPIETDAQNTAQFANLPTPLVPDVMDIENSLSGQGKVNNAIFSHRLRTGVRGD